MQFEWNEGKSEACFKGRGFDFAYAAMVFAAPNEGFAQTRGTAMAKTATR
jgi:uncharacterized DUF497 family protein